MQGASPINAADTPTLRRVLVIRRGGIGDIILATPALRMLAARLPNARIDLLVQQGASEAASGLPYINEIHEVDTRSNPVSLYRLRQLAQRLRGLRYDLIVNYQPGAKTRFLARFGKPRFTLEFQKDRSIQPDTGQVRHAIDDFVQTLMPLNLGDVYDRSLDFAIPDAARARVDSLLRDRGYRVGESRQPLIVINPTARRVVNRWPAEQWAKLIDGLCTGESHQVVIIGAGRDLPLVCRVKKMCGQWNRVIDFSGLVSLKELGALLEHAAAFVTADTGPMHVGSAVGAPMICLSGAADPHRTGPSAPNSVILIDRSLPCVPCQQKQCRYSRLPRCMEFISADQVLAAHSANGWIIYFVSSIGAASIRASIGNCPAFMSCT